jgi:hypothetical protein
VAFAPVLWVSATSGRDCIVRHPMTTVTMQRSNHQTSRMDLQSDGELLTVSEIYHWGDLVANFISIIYI